MRFLFNAMAPKAELAVAFQGIPEAIYSDNGPIAKSHIFQRVLDSLGVRLMTHMPSASDRTGAARPRDQRAKSNVPSAS